MLLFLTLWESDKVFWRHDVCCHDNFPKRHRTDPPCKVGNVSCQDKGASPTFFCVTVALQISDSAIVKLSVTAALWRGVTVTPLQWSYASLHHCVSEVLRHIKLCVTTAVWRFVVASQWHFVIASLRHCHALILRHSVTFALHQLLNKLIILWTLKHFQKKTFFSSFFKIWQRLWSFLYTAASWFRKPIANVWKLFSPVVQNIS
jgi:hypothetical protein